MIVLAGTAIATKQGKKVATFGPGDFFGEIALLDPGLRTATVVATSPMSVAVVGQRELARYSTKFRRSHKVMRGLARRLRELDQPKVE